MEQNRADLSTESFARVRHRNTRREIETFEETAGAHGSENLENTTGI